MPQKIRSSTREKLKVKRGRPRGSKKERVNVYLSKDTLILIKTMVERGYAKNPSDCIDHLLQAILNLPNPQIQKRLVANYNRLKFISEYLPSIEKFIKGNRGRPLETSEEVMRKLIYGRRRSK